MRLGIIITFAFAAMVLGTATQQADARPNYLKKFMGDYPKVKEAEEKKCFVCHGKDKKKRNNFGMALGKALDAEKVMDDDKIEEALKKVEKEDSKTEGKTFGDLLEAGELPGELIE